MRSISTCAAALLLLFSAGCGGGSSTDTTPTPSPTPPPGFNLDFHTSYTPIPDTYAGAGSQAGTWVDCALGTTSALTNVAGTVTAASITLVGRTDTFNTPVTDTGFLISDSVVNDDFFGMIPFSATLTGLENGEYDIVYYYHSPTSGLTANGVPMTDLTGMGNTASRDTLGAQGFNWDVVRVMVTTGGLIILDGGGAGSDGLSGIQIIPVP